MENSRVPTAFIDKQHHQIKNSLPFDDKRDFVNATRGLRGRKPNVVQNGAGVTVWSNDSYQFLSHEDAPLSANPSLWRQSRLAYLDGLLKVTPHIFQVRGLDLSNTTIIEGDEGPIVIDPLTSQETGAAALGLYRDVRKSNRPVKAVIYTHSRVDHFGGVKGFISEEDVANNGIKIFAPDGFLEHAVSENVFTGTATSRRSAYMYGAALEQGPKAQIGAGLGQTVSTGNVTLIAPNEIIKRTGEKRKVDGVEMVFQMAPDTEEKALCAAEDATHTFHNVLTLRGAVVRDPHVWAKYLTETIDMFGKDAQVVFASHHWPTWGNEELVNFLTLQRDLYAYVHDQTLRLLNKGCNGPEIAEMMTLPSALETAWCARGYYGSTSHNVKAIYQRYVGWFDGNPAHLWEHTAVDRAKRYVAMVGRDKMLAESLKHFEKGDFRWAAEILNHVVFADPNDTEAKHQLANTYEQLGYGAENGTWRNFFMSGTKELRDKNFGTPTQTASADVISQLTPEMLFDSLAIQINGPEAEHKTLSIGVTVTDMKPKDPYRLWLSNGALIYSNAQQDGDAAVTLTGTAKQLTTLATAGPNVRALRKAGVEVSGDEMQLHTLSSLLDPGDPNFNIVTP